MHGNLLPCILLYNIRQNYYAATTELQPISLDEVN